MPHETIEEVETDARSSGVLADHPRLRSALELVLVALLALTVCAMALSAQAPTSAERVHAARHSVDHAAVHAVHGLGTAAVPEQFEAARAYIERVMAERNLPSVAVAVAQEGEVLWEAAFGWADRERRVGATPHTPYSLASISKPIVATALMTLVEDGGLDLDRPANDYLGAARIRAGAGTASGATVRRVLSHTAGLPLHWRFFFEDDPHPVASHDEAIARYAVTVNAPGARYEYSNIGFGVVGRVVEWVAGEPLDDVVRREVYAPLGMTRSSVNLPPELEPYAARRYDGDGERLPDYVTDHDGASAMWSSAHDLIRFALFHLGHVPEGARAPLADSTRRLMQTPVDPADYGLGWFIEDDEFGLRSVWHSGSMAGVSTMFRMYPERDLAVVVLLNTLDRTMRLRIAQELVAAVVPGYEERLREAERERERRQAAAAEEEEDEEGGEGPSFDPPASLRGEWGGVLRTYEREVPMRIVVHDDGDVHVDIDGQLETVLNRPRWDDGRLSGAFAGRIPTADALRHDHDVRLEVVLRDDGRLTGRATAMTNGADGGSFALSSYVELSRAVAAGVAR
ncbi:MAG: serine hydrolase domain-containing protein [Gemmatimonadota bacterium]